jgi:gephyrin
MLSVSDAVAKILENTPQPVKEVRDLTPDLIGYVIAEDIRAAEAVPAYPASIVDGYAVIVPNIPDPDAQTKAKTTTTTHEEKDTDDLPLPPTKEPFPSGVKGVKGIFPVASVSHAQATSMPPPLSPGQIARITTGAPLPLHANAVVMVEDTAIASLTEDKSEEATVEILTDDISVGENIRLPGSDIKLGEVILSRGTQISAVGGEIGVLAAAGISKVPVFRKPRVGVMSTGDEVTDISFQGPLRGGMIRDSNRPSLLSLLRGWNLCEDDGGVVDLHVARDTPNTELEEKIREAFRTRGLDIVITTGGVSMGELDLLKPTIERQLGGVVHFGRVSMKPGKPTTFASVPFKDSVSGQRGDDRAKKLIFGLPGNPASALVTANLFVLPCVQAMAGLEDKKGLERVVVTIQGGRVKCDKARVEYHRVVVGVDGSSGRLVATSTGMQRSSRVGSLAAANALLVLPQREGWVEDGAQCEALMMGMVHGS